MERPKRLDGDPFGDKNVGFGALGVPGPAGTPLAPRGPQPFMAWLCHVILPGMAKPEAWKRGMATLNP